MTNTKSKISFVRPHDAPDLGPFIRYSASLNLPMIERDSHKGQTAVICSTGGTIRRKEVMRSVKKLHGDGAVIIGLKETIPYLKEQGVKVTYSVSMDPGGERQVNRTPIDPDVIYCIASSCNPLLFDHLRDNDCEVRIFHSACGHSEPVVEKGLVASLSDQGHAAAVKGEFELQTLDGEWVCPIITMMKPEMDIYAELFPCIDTMGGGFTVTNRAFSLIEYMGFEKIYMAGTDFGWRNVGGSHYSDLVKVPTLDQNPMCDGGIVDGVNWYTKPDQLASAAAVARHIKAGRVTVLGDSLAVALAKHDDEFIESVVKINKRKI